MSKKIYILGAGLVGSAIAADLVKNGYDVTTVDSDREALSLLKKRSGVRTILADISAVDELHRIIEEASLVVGAVPGHLGFNML
ncbi:MAG TPA: NAD-binding protein, partial [Bacteroidales bacterium]|nr:NAD-binding protein [Bacteroidales bacterium]